MRPKTTWALAGRTAHFPPHSIPPPPPFPVLEEELGVKNARLTVQPEPIILAEVMPAAAVISLMVSTFALFAAGIALTLSGGVFRGSSNLDVPWAAATGNTNGGGGGNICGNQTAPTVVPAAVPDDGGPSAFGCTDFYPTVRSIFSLRADGASSDGTSSSTLTAIAEEQEQEQQQIYGAIFESDFAGLSGLYGSVSLRAAFSDEYEGDSGGAGPKSLPEPVVVDLVVEACTQGAAGEYGVCDGGWQPVLSQVRRQRKDNLCCLEYRIQRVFPLIVTAFPTRPTFQWPPFLFRYLFYFGSFVLRLFSFSTYLSNAA